MARCGAPTKAARARQEHVERLVGGLKNPDRLALNDLAALALLTVVAGWADGSRT